MTFLPGARVACRTVAGELAGTVRGVTADGLYAVDLDAHPFGMLFLAAALRPLPAADGADEPHVVQAASAPSR